MTAYYNENDPFAAAWLKELIKAGCIAPGEVDTRSIEDVCPSDLRGFAQCHFFAGIGVWSYALRLSGWPDDRPVWTGSCPCFPADTMVHTDEGLIPIQDIRVGMNVLTHKKRWRKVLRTGCDLHKTTVVVKGQGHYGLVCTPNHPFLTPEDTWVAAEHMVKRRWINACCQPAVAIPVPEKTVRGLTVRGGRFRVTGWKDGKAVYLGTYGSAEEAKNVRDAAIAKGIISVRGADNVDVTSGAFAYFLGRWIGDGWITGDSILLCDSSDKESEIVSTMREAGMSYSVSRERTTVRVRCGSQWLSGYLSEYFGTRSGNKKLPAWLLGAPLEYVRLFIQGWVDSDGSRDRNCLAISTVSKNLAIGLKFLLLRCGFSPILTRTEDRKTVIEGRTVNAKAYIRVSWYPSSRSFRFGVHGGEGLVRKVLPGVSADVYNLEVEEDNSYVADGIVVHNCQPFSAAGKRKGTADERHLWPVWFKLIKSVRPPVIFGEQVALAAGSNLQRVSRGKADFRISSEWERRLEMEVQAVFGTDEVQEQGDGEPVSIKLPEEIPGERPSASREIQGFEERGSLRSGSAFGADPTENRQRLLRGDRTSFQLGRRQDVGQPIFGQNHSRAGLHNSQSACCLPRSQQCDGRLGGTEDSGYGPGNTGKAHRGVQRAFEEARREFEKDDRATWIDLVLFDLERSDYTVGACIAPAAGFGAPHIRQRLYWVADASERGIRTRDWQPCESIQRKGTDRGHGFSCGMDDAGGTRLEGYAGDADDKTGRQEQDGPAPASGSTGSPVQTNGFWRDADWLYCRDGRWRAVEPGSFPLAHGSTNRVGRLRGYGNAIVAPQAEAFIRAYMEIIQEGTWSIS